MKKRMRVGVFHPCINYCGGAEWVAVNILNCLRKAHHETILLSNEKIDQNRMKKLFGTEANADSQMVFPFELFAATDMHNIYTDFVRTLALKSKCDLLIDTYSNGILPGTDIVYVHFPFEGRLPLTKGSKDLGRKLKNFYYVPYLLYERCVRNGNRIFFANSAYTMKAITEFNRVSSTVLHPPIGKEFFVKNSSSERANLVVSVGRISSEKRFWTIPQIAKLTDKSVRFLIMGLNESPVETIRIRRLIEANDVSDRVKVETDVPREKLKDILATSKVFLHTMIGEHFGVSIAEAMASGCVSIVHNSGGPIEFVPKQYRFDDVKEAAEKINKAVLEWSPGVAEEFTMRAQQFSAEHFCASFLRVFDSHLAKLQN
ncbi:glycosyltransferase [Candidatus Bathyarchaeota archaeon]|nr:glycosyltransferase [Candidatus Bathyarchaeota archaeon]